MRNANVGRVFAAIAAVAFIATTALGVMAATQGPLSSALEQAMRPKNSRSTGSQA